MITLQKNASSTVVVTLSEKTTTATGHYLFEFTHQMTGEVKIFTADDTSTATGRYNQFTIIDDTIEDPYDGTMNFQMGFHTYTIYNMALTSPFDLDPDNAIEVVEVGKVFVSGPEDTTEYFDDNFIKDVPVWTGTNV